MTKRRKTALALIGLLAMSVAATAQLGDIIKIGGIGLLISRFGPDINKAINRLTKTPDNDKFATKVVPILSAGDGTAIGGAQVMGPRAAVDRVQAVAQLEGDFRGLGVRLRALVPIATKSVTDIKRVTGVGISGLVDLKL
jgi:hypothetical protein